jgi:hypothetical protein
VIFLQHVTLEGYSPKFPESDRNTGKWAWRRMWLTMGLDLFDTSGSRKLRLLLARILVCVYWQPTENNRESQRLIAAHA